MVRQKNGIMNTKEQLKDRLDLISSAKLWPLGLQTARICRILGMPPDIYARVLQAEVVVMQAAEMQRRAVDSMLEWEQAQQAAQTTEVQS